MHRGHLNRPKGFLRTSVSGVWAFIIYRKRPVISPSLSRCSGATMEIQLARGNVFHNILFYRATDPYHFSSPPVLWCPVIAPGRGRPSFDACSSTHVNGSADRTRFVFRQRLLRVSLKPCVPASPKPQMGIHVSFYPFHSLAVSACPSLFTYAEKTLLFRSPNRYMCRVYT